MVRKRFPPGQENRDNSTTGLAKVNTSARVEHRQMQSKWLALAIASGMFAALNGVFAKLTTTRLTSSLSRGIVRAFALAPSSDRWVEYIIRTLFFALNLLSNFAMWTLFTRALTASPSTTKATITNTTANFLFTALLGMLVFGEQVAGLWWVGASLMAVGCVLVGLREGAQDAEKDYVQGKDDRVPLAERVEQGT